MTKAEYREITEIMAKYGIDNRHDATWFHRAQKRGLEDTLANIREKQERARENAALPVQQRKVKKAGYYENWAERHERCIEVLQAKWQMSGLGK